jgi:hypothetical protein
MRRNKYYNKCQESPRDFVLQGGRSSLGRLARQHDLVTLRLEEGLVSLSAEASEDSSVSDGSRLLWRRWGLPLLLEDNSLPRACEFSSEPAESTQLSEVGEVEE